MGDISIIARQLSDKYVQYGWSGNPHWVGTSELDIYSKIAFVDHAYFYDGNHQWYYIVPTVMWAKVPISLIVAHLNERSDILPEFRLALETAVFNAVHSCYRSDEQFHEYVARLGYDDNRMDQLRQAIKKSGDKLFYWNNCELLEILKNLYRYFALWAVVVKEDEGGRGIGRVILKSKSEPYVETIFWS